MRNLSMNIIRWCNENNGFLTAILSLIGLVLSVTAIVVSIRTARLPYKKKLMLGSYMSVGASMIPGVGAETQILGMSASATNVGNRTINITYLGYAIKKDGRYNMIYPVNRDFDGKASLNPSEMAETQFYKDELLKCFSKENRKTKAVLRTGISTQKKSHLHITADSQKFLRMKRLKHISWTITANHLEIIIGHN